MSSLTPLRNMLLVVLVAWIAASYPQPAAAVDYDTPVRFIYVQKGQTLHNIVRRIYPDKKKDWSKIRKEIVRTNPHAFPRGTESSMRADVKIKLPGKKKAAVPAKRVGSVVTARGRAIAVGKDKVKRKLVAGDPVYIGDKLITGEDGFLRLSMIDKAQLDIRCYSIMVIEDYNLRPASRRSILNLLQGSLRKITGEIGKLGEDVYELKTPVASVGVRGTEYALRVFQSKGCDGSIDTDDEALYLQVIKGLVDVENKAASTTVAKGDTVYIPLPDTKPVAKEIDEGVIVTEDDASEDQSFWWYLLGGVALLLLL